MPSLLPFPSTAAFVGETDEKSQQHTSPLPCNTNGIESNVLVVKANDLADKADGVIARSKDSTFGNKNCFKSKRLRFESFGIIRGER